MPLHARLRLRLNTSSRWFIPKVADISPQFAQDPFIHAHSLALLSYNATLCTACCESIVRVEGWPSHGWFNAGAVRRLMPS